MPLFCSQLILVVLLFPSFPLPVYTSTGSLLNVFIVLSSPIKINESGNEYFSSLVVNEISTYAYKYHYSLNALVSLTITCISSFLLPNIIGFVCNTGL